MPTPISVVDAFAARPFEGNPAAVCLAPSGSTESWMASVAAEMNLSETAFPVRRSDGDWDLRWFTPTMEVRLCGHATLATAHRLWECGLAPSGEAVRFHTRSGRLVCRRNPGTQRVEMDFPARPALEVSAPAGLAEALGTELAWCGRGEDDLLVEVADATTVRKLRPDLAALAQLPVRGVIVTAASDSPEFGFVSRFFAPALGIDEDPVTGSAHCTLACHWADRLGRTALSGFQASARGGTVGMELQGDRVRLLGHAVTAWRGQWLGPVG
jgi:PhzF family phenazine biosynthesis protein